MLWGAFIYLNVYSFIYLLCCQGLAPLALSDRSIVENQYKYKDHLHRLMKQFYLDGCGLAADAAAPIHSAWWLTEWMKMV